MQQRYYDQGVGRFLSADPVASNSANGGNFNRYWYANNNPYRFTDPDGRAAIITEMEDNSISIQFPTEFKGDEAHEANIAAISRSVANLSGTYKIDGEDRQVNFSVTNVDDSTESTRVFQTPKTPDSLSCR